LEELNAYPPRFHLSFCNDDSIKHLSISITVQLEKSKQKSKGETLNFFVDTLDYTEFFTKEIDVAPQYHSGTFHHVTCSCECVRRYEFIYV